MIAYYEGETQHPPSTILPKLAIALDVSTDELLNLSSIKKTTCTTATVYLEVKSKSKRELCVREMYNAKDVIIIQGDSRKALEQMPDNTFQSCITSPPYWGLRDYGIEGQIGAEKDPKDLIGIPWRLAFALQEDGWFLRSDIIWNKPNCQPESVKDRPTRAHEYIFLLTKSKMYDYDHDAVKEPSVNGGKAKNRRSVWNIKTNGFHGAHFAVFPPELVRLCLLAGSAPGSKIIDPFFASGTVGVVSQEAHRFCTGIELNPEYIKIAVDRISNVYPTLAF